MRHSYGTHTHTCDGEQSRLPGAGAQQGVWRGAPTLEGGRARGEDAPPHPVPALTGHAKLARSDRLRELK